MEQTEKVDFATLFDGDDVVVLQVGDSSLTDAGLSSGDHLVVRRTTEWRDGDVCVLDGKPATVRRLFRDGAKVRLEPLASFGKSTVVRDVAVVGVVQGWCGRRGGGRLLTPRFPCPASATDPSGHSCRLSRCPWDAASSVRVVPLPQESRGR